MKTRRLAVVSAGLTQPSSTRLLADRLAAAAEGELSLLDIRPETRHIELRQHGRDVMNHLLTGFPSAGLGQVIGSVTGADGLIAVTPIFNASYSGLFKCFFDGLEGDALAEKPVLIAATGGTARHSLALEHALRPLFVYLHADVVPTSVYAAPEDWAGARVDGRGDDPAGSDATDPPGPAGAAANGRPDRLHARIQRAAREFAGLVSHHEPATVADPFALTTSFEDLFPGA